MMLISRHSSLLLPLAMWVVTTQLGQILPHVDCTGGLSWTWITTLAAAAIALASVTAPCLLALRENGRTPSFLGRLRLLIGGVITFALVLQVVASLLVNPCLR